VATAKGLQMYKILKLIKIYKAINSLIDRYKKEIEDLKENDNFKDEQKVITVTVLRDIIFDLEQIVDKEKK